VMLRDDGYRNVLTADRLRDWFAGRSVALVGNAPAILTQQRGAEIDEHDLVIRMNAAMPYPDNAAAIGRRTDFWATARWDEDTFVRYLSPRAVLWMKLTLLGTDHYLRAVRVCEEKGYPLWRWPATWEQELRSRLGSWPSTGFRLAWALATKARAAVVDLYGFTFFGDERAGGGEPGHWYRPATSRPMRTPVGCGHDGAAEYHATLEFGYAQDGVGVMHFRSPIPETAR
jgi:hypothetical protein